MFNDEGSIAFKKMHNISTVDGFVEIIENLADMIKFVANEPSVGLFYVQQHTQKAIPNLVNLKNNITKESHKKSLHTEDLEDSITMLQSMKECGYPAADEMIRDIKKSLSIISSKQPKRGLLYNSSSGFLGRTSSWSVFSRRDSETSSDYLSSVFKMGKQQANGSRQAPVDSMEAGEPKDEKIPFDFCPTFTSSSDSHVTVAEDEVGRELQEESQLSKSLSHQKFLSLYENYDEFKAEQEVKLEEWLRETCNRCHDNQLS